MYAERQNKGKVSRRIDRSDTARQWVDIENRRKKFFSSNTAQFKFYMDNGIELTEELLIYEELQKKLSYPPCYILELAAALFQTYQHDKNMIISCVLDVMRDNSPQNLTINVQEIIKELDDIDQSEINSKIKTNRIRNDKRLSSDAQENYILNGNKNEVEILRERTRIDNKNVADAELKNGDYIKNNYVEIDFRKINHPNAFNLFRDCIPFTECYLHVLNEVVTMRHDLVASWYFNKENEDEIFSSGELKSFSLRNDIDSNTVRKSMFGDTKKNRTGRYFYSFIEHKDSEFNYNTRFTQIPTRNGIITPRGVNDGSGRRLRIPLKKMVKAYAIIMGGDLISDRQEEKMGLKQNQTPQKIFASGVTSSDLDLRMMNILANYVNFSFERICLALKDVNSMSKAINTIYRLKSKSGRILWEDLTRNVAQPQLMTPNRVSLGMKGIKLDSSPIIIDI